MKINAKYGIVAALTMAAFVAPSVGAVTIGDDTTKTDAETKEIIEKSAPITFAAGDKLDLGGNRTFDGSKIGDILNTAKFIDKDGKTYALTDYVSAKDGTAYSKASLTWTVKIDGTTESDLTKVAKAGAYEITVADQASTPVPLTAVTFTISKATITDRTVTVAEPIVYNGNNIAPTFKVGGIIVTGTANYAKGTTVLGSSVKDAGTYNVTLDVSADDNIDLGKDENGAAITADKFTGTVEVSPFDISKTGYASITGITDPDYSGKAEKPAATVNVNLSKVKGNNTTWTLATDADKITDAKYTVSYGSNTEVGKDAGSITVTGKGNFTGSITKTFEIKGKTLSSVMDSTSTYTGSDITPKKLGNYTSGFTITFDANQDTKNVGKATYTVTGDNKNLYNTPGGTKGTLTIKQLSFAGAGTANLRESTAQLTNTGIEVIIKSAAYNGGSLVTPKVEVYADGNLVSASEYKVVVRESDGAKELGKAGNFYLTKSDSASATNVSSAESNAFAYTVKGATISSATVSGIAKAYTYNGKTKEPTPTVTLNGEKLVEGTDYVVSYKNNLNVGTATVTINGIGDYTGKVTKTFYIDPAKSSIKKVAVGAKKMTVTVKKGAKATGVQIGYRVKGTSKWSYTKTTSTSKTIKSLKKGKKYQVVVRSYTTNKSGKITNYSGWSATKTSAKIK